MFSWIKRNWGHVVGATLALLAVFTFIPGAWATISYDVNNWVIAGTDTTGGALSKNIDTTGDILILDLNSSAPINGSITFQSTVITASNNDVLSGYTDGFALTGLTGGNYTLSVTTTNFNTGNSTGTMFSGTPVSSTEPSLTSQNLLGSPVISITFSFTNATFLEQPSTPFVAFHFNS